MQPIFPGSWVIDVANGSSIPERSKGSAGVARQRMTQLSRTAATPQLASTSLRKSAHMALRSAGPIQGRAARPIYLASLAGRGRKPRAAQLSDEGKDSAAIFGSSRSQMPVTPTLSRKRSEGPGRLRRGRATVRKLCRQARSVSNRPRLCENSRVQFARRKFISIWSGAKAGAPASVWSARDRNRGW
jgi:hypothetical protein